MKIRTQTKFAVATLAIALWLFPNLSAQVTIGTDEAPVAGALLQLKGSNDIPGGEANSTKGMILPRVHLQSLTSLQPCADETQPEQAERHTGLTIYSMNHCIENSYGKGVYTWMGDHWEYLMPRDNASLIKLPSIASVSPLSITTYDCPVSFTAVPDAGATIDWYDTDSEGTKVQTGNVYTVTPPVNQTTKYYTEALDPVTGCVSGRSEVSVTTEKPYINGFNRTAQNFGTALNTASSITFNTNGNWSYSVASGNFAKVVTSPSLAANTVKATGAAPTVPKSDTWTFRSSGDYSDEWNTAYSTVLTFKTSTSCGTQATQNVTLSRTVPYVFNTPTIKTPANGATVGYGAFNAQLCANANGTWSGHAQLTWGNAGTQIGGATVTRPAGWANRCVTFSVQANAARASRSISIGVKNKDGAYTRLAVVTQQGVPWVECPAARVLIHDTKVYGNKAQAVAACNALGTGWRLITWAEYNSGAMSCSFDCAGWLGDLMGGNYYNSSVDGGGMGGGACRNLRSDESQPLPNNHPTRCVKSY